MTPPRAQVPQLMMQAGVGGHGMPAGGGRMHMPPGRMYRPRLQAKNVMQHPMMQNGECKAQECLDAIKDIIADSISKQLSCWEKPSLLTGCKQMIGLIRHLC